MRAYTGPGYIDTIEALRRIAEARFPERWGDNIPTAERTVWDGLGTVYNPAIWLDHLRVLVPPPPSDGLIARAADYQEACMLLLDALLSNRLTVWITEDDGNMRQLEERSWRMRDAAQALFKGTAWIDEGTTEVCRLLLLPTEKAAALWQNANSKQNTNAATPQKHRGGRPPKHDPAHVQSIVFRLMNENGEFNVAIEVWNAQARLEDAVRVELGSDLSEGRLRKVIEPHLSAWRATKA